MMMTPKEKREAAMNEIAEKHRTTVKRIMQRGRAKGTKRALAARKECAVMLLDSGLSSTRAGQILGGRHHSTVLYLAGRVNK